jgi:UDP-N-acetylglucosamine 2-epimerase (non-hydrolysing)
MTMHRPATVDFPGQLKRMLDLVQLLSLRHRVVFPIHPRTQARLEQHALLDRLRTIPGIIMCGPLGYHAFQKLLATSAFVVTDSGGVQEETTYCGIPCLTLRPNTERPVTITEGTNELMPFDLDILAKAVASIEAGTTKKGRIPELWDGRATERIMEILHQVL